MIARLPVWLARLGYRVAYVGLAVWSRLARPTTRGVKVLVFCDGELLLIRHSYGGGRWDLPGGFCKRAEPFGDAARREISEELGVEVTELTDLGERRRGQHGRKEILRGFRAEIADRQLTLARAEIADARWFAPGTLPAGAARIVGEIHSLTEPADGAAVQSV